MSEQTVWDIHAGKHGEAHELFINNCKSGASP